MCQGWRKKVGSEASAHTCLTVLREKEVSCLPAKANLIYPFSSISKSLMRLPILAPFPSL